ncbi:MAG: hypothetical protein BM560_17000 [Roseobacter sp. MedPE-SWde]|uniref:DUF6331 family protein n=1 Tax=Rhodobacterales TaxID=204455 RepID=UPI000068E071|nr:MULTISPECIES: DUF6331 family protein [Rhodobacterales]EAQ45513.1 hypothetical protein MED193_07668 [Roseobacter sp. MED193]OIQ39322.1 MAG: hypothetical protein BM560_17000 [Roseobacter sp. MedPE-SWde]
MKIEYPLLGMIQNCATICEPECCGIDAFEFSPFHIASYLLRYTGRIDQEELDKIRNQLSVLNASYGTAGTQQEGCTLDEMNQIFSGKDINNLVKTIDLALDRACELISAEPPQSGL